MAIPRGEHDDREDENTSPARGDPNASMDRRRTIEEGSESDTAGAG